VATSIDDAVKGFRERCVKSILDLVILRLLLEKPLGAYEIIGAIHNKSGVMLSPGTVYPTLFSLERKKLIETEWVSRKKVYKLSNTGRSTVDKLSDAYLQAHGEIPGILGVQGKAITAERVKNLGRNSEA